MLHRALSFLSVDPGIAYFAWAKICDLEVSECGIWRGSNHDLTSAFPGIDTCLVEEQKIHRGKEKYKADILLLARSAGEIAGQFRHRIYWPLSALPKKVFQERAMACLSEKECALVERHTKADQRHIKDAIGFAMRYLGRM